MYMHSYIYTIYILNEKQEQKDETQKTIMNK